jgi:hypothetical protein
VRFYSSLSGSSVIHTIVMQSLTGPLRRLPHTPRSLILTYDFGQLLPAERDSGQLHADAAEAPAQALRGLLPSKRQLPAEAGPERRDGTGRGGSSLVGTEKGGIWALEGQDAPEKG